MVAAPGSPTFAIPPPKPGLVSLPRGGMSLLKSQVTLRTRAGCPCRAGAAGGLMAPSPRPSPGRGTGGARHGLPAGSRAAREGWCRAGTGQCTIN